MTKFISDKRFQYDDDLIVVTITAFADETWAKVEHKGGVIIRENVGGCTTQGEADRVAIYYSVQAINYLEAEKKTFEHVG